MPEGDTIYRTAHTLAKVLEGKTLVAFRSPLPHLAEARVAGRRVTQVEARGKNLLIHFDDSRALYTHLRMNGSWHVYRVGERWRKPERQARAVLQTDQFVAVCFNAPVVQLLSSRQLARHPALCTLGPDLLGADFDLAEARRRLRSAGELTIGEALLHQRLAAGVGNVFKSETLFLCRINPFRRVSQLADADLERVLGCARALLQANAQGWPRMTRRAPGSRYWVYARSGQPCFNCGAPIQMQRQGPAARSTYWCPVCQPAPATCAGPDPRRSL
jgi:endonuclease-8